MFLTPRELEELTERKRKSDQIAWLKANGYPFAIGANGHPRVSRDFVLAKLRGESPRPVGALEPDFSVLDPAA